MSVESWRGRVLAVVSTRSESLCVNWIACTSPSNGSVWDRLVSRSVLRSVEYGVVLEDGSSVLARDCLPVWSVLDVWLVSIVSSTGNTATADCFMTALRFFNDDTIAGTV